MQVLSDWSTRGQVVHAEKVSIDKQHHVACDDWPSSLHSEYEPIVKISSKHLRDLTG